MEDTLATWDLLQGLHPVERAHVLAATTEAEFRRGARLFDEGDAATAIHFIESGRVAVQKVVPTGAAVTVEMRGPGDVVGVISALRDAGRNCAVLAVEETRTRALTRVGFEDLRYLRGVDAALAHLLADEVARLRSLVAEAHFAPAASRIMRRLLDLAPRGAPPPVSVSVHQADLAALAGTTRETVNRVLRAAETSDLLSVHRDRIIILDPAAIEAGL